MSVKSVTYYEVTCDHETCGVDLYYVTGEYMALGSYEYAIDQWKEAGGILTDLGETFCEEHLPAEEEDGEVAS